MLKNKIHLLYCGFGVILLKIVCLIREGKIYMQSLRVSHFYDFTARDKSEWQEVFAEFAKNNAKFLTINTALLQKMLADETLAIEFTQQAKSFGLQALDIHGLCGKNYDLNIVDSNQREIMLHDHAKAFRLARKIGAETYVMHIGAWCCVENCWYGNEDNLRSLAIQTLEKLLPIAEENNITIAIENAFEPSNTPDELLYYLERVKSPALGVCFDAGHATMMSGEVFERDPAENNHPLRQRLWHGRLEFQYNAIESLLPHIVTCHLHDNDGFDDQHNLIFSGVADWQKYAANLAKAPRLKSIQNEIKSGSTTIAEMCQAFDRLHNIIKG